MAGLEPATCRLRIECFECISFVLNVSASAKFGMIWACSGLKLATHLATRFVREEDAASFVLGAHQLQENRLSQIVRRQITDFVRGTKLPLLRTG
jgi:hypothetical protein